LKWQWQAPSEVPKIGKASGLESIMVGSEIVLVM